MMSSAGSKTPSSMARGATAARRGRRRRWASTSASARRGKGRMAGDKTNIISPAGYAALRAEYDALLGGERPKLVEVISWAAGNGDRSENGDDIYGRKRLREIDRRLGFLGRRLKAARVRDPPGPPAESPPRVGRTAGPQTRRP